MSEAAREYEEARAQKRRYEEVPVLTGEEEEANVLQVNIIIQNQVLASHLVVIMNFNLNLSKIINF